MCEVRLPGIGVHGSTANPGSNPAFLLGVRGGMMIIEATARAAAVQFILGVF
jgi:hypothetical protein